MTVKKGYSRRINSRFTTARSERSEKFESEDIKEKKRNEVKKSNLSGYHRQVINAPSTGALSK